MNGSEARAATRAVRGINGVASVHTTYRAGGTR